MCEVGILSFRGPGVIEYESVIVGQPESCMSGDDLLVEMMMMSSAPGVRS